jgi:hypothetical protein
MKFDFEQEFLPVNYKPKFKIYRFNIYKLTPTDLFPPENIEYYSFLDPDSGEIAMLGVMWLPLLNGKNFEIRTRMLTGKGDDETFRYIAESVLDILGENRIKELKSKETSTVSIERNDA